MLEQAVTSHVEKVQSSNGSELATILSALTELQRGNASVRLPAEWTGTFGKIAETFNDVVEQNRRMYGELERLSRVVGREGKLNKRASVGYVSGFWRDSIECVNGLIDDLVHPTTETARVIGAVAQGDLAQTMALEIDDRPLQGEFLRTAKTVNKMVNQLGSFASEVTRVAREVGTEGKLGGQAKVKGVAGTWKDLTDSVNSMAGNLTGQVRNIADVTTAVVTSAILRTWPVRLPAIELTLSVKSFHVPATPFTLAWPPSLPSVPTSRATRVTSDANEPSWLTILLTVLAVRRNSPCSGRSSISRAIV